MISKGKSYQEIYNGFSWDIPEKYNIGIDICDRWAGQDNRLALIYEDGLGNSEKYTFWDLKVLSNRLANTLAAHGVGRGDRVGILLDQCVEAGLAHLALYKLGAIAVPLSTQFGIESLMYRLSNSEAKAVITNADNIHKVLEVNGAVPSLETLVQARDQAPPGVVDFWAALQKASPIFTAVDTAADDPALLIYTSGTAGPPRGALHAHRCLPGQLPGVRMQPNLFTRPDELFWTPADWAWVGGLLDVLLTCWRCGVPVLACPDPGDDPERIYHLLAKHGVRSAFLPPTTLKMMRQAPPRQRRDLRLGFGASGGETLGRGLLEWGREALGLTINEFYGTTEVNLVVGNCSELMEVRPGSMGRPLPGHYMAVVDDQGRPLPIGQVGQVACHRPDPVMFLEYWKNPAAYREKFAGDWYLSGDLAARDQDGYFWFVGRADDLITSAGRRVGTSEIEDCLIRHPAVAMAAVIGVPDQELGSAAKAFIVPRHDAAPGPQLEREIQELVRNRLADHQYPRRMEFVSELPMTVTGKIKRRDLRQRELDKLNH